MKAPPRYRQAILLVDLTLFVAIFVLALSFYLGTLAPTVAEMFSDTLEFQLVAFQLGIAHPTGYPLYILLGKLFTLLPWGDVAYRLNLMSAWWAALTASLVYAIVASFTVLPSTTRRGLGATLPMRFAAASGALCLAFSPVFWSQAVVAEVYTLNTFFIALGVWLAVLFWRRAIGPAPLAFVLGLGLTHHRTFMLLLLALAPMLWLTWRDREGRAGMERREWAKLAGLFLLPLCLYAYLPLRGTSISSLDGEYHNTLTGFLDWISGRAYGVFVIGNPWRQTTNPLTVYLEALLSQYRATGLALGIFGAAWVLWRERTIGLILFLFFLLSAGFGALYRVADVEPFFLPSFLVFAVWIGLGAAGFIAMLRHLLRRCSPLRVFTVPVTVALWAVSLILVFLPISRIQAVMPEVDHHGDQSVRNYGEDVLSQPLEQNAAIVGLGGEITLFSYLQQTEGRRPDLLLVRADDEKPRLARVDELMARGIQVYVTRPLPGLAEKYSLSSVGPLVAVHQTPSNLVPDSLRRIDASFQGEAVLLGAIVAEPASDGRPLRVTVYWRAGRPQGDHMVFIHVLDADGQQVAQTDQRPVGGAYPMPSWREGEVITDTYDVSLPVGLPPGAYTLCLGMYDPSSGRRIEVDSSSGSPDMSLVLGTVQVQRDNSVPPRRDWGAWTWSGNGATYDGIRLVGVRWEDRSYEPGKPLALTTLWQTERSPRQDHQVRIGLLDYQKRPVLDRLFDPASGRYPTTQWPDNGIVRLQHQLLLPPDLPDGTFVLRIGLGDAPALTVGTIQIRGRERQFDKPNPDFRLDFPLGDGIMLTGFDLWLGSQRAGATEPLSVEAGQVCRLVLYWHALGATNQPFKVFVHLVDGNGKIITQDDAEPRGGEAPTTSWAKGEFVADEHVITLPPGVAKGEGRLIVGMYDPVSGERLHSPDGDAIQLVKVTIE